MGCYGLRFQLVDAFLAAQLAMLLAYQNGGFSEIISGYFPEDELRNYLEVRAGITSNG
jgi:hypothetical protein